MKTQSIKNKIKIVAPRSYRSVQIPKVEKMPVEDFMGLPPVFCQRTVKFRAPKTKKLLENIDLVKDFLVRRNFICLIWMWQFLNIPTAAELKATGTHEMFVGRNL